MKLFELPRQLGQNSGRRGDFSVGIGRFGPFVKAGSTYASIPAGTDPYEIDLDAAVELVRAKREALANRLINSFQDGSIQVLRGKFGPYITDVQQERQDPEGRRA
jgi:DNA topoisomerase-1